MIKLIKNSQYLILLCLLMVSSLTYAQGSRYTGTYKNSAPIQYKNKSNIIIEGLEISNIDRLGIALFNCDNVIIRNCKFKNIGTSVAIYAEKSSNITIQDCSFENVHRGVMASMGTGNIKIEHNDFKNILGENQGGSIVSFAAQFNKCSGAGNSISYNSIENIQGESSPADIINVFASNGTSASPIIVNNNWLRGGGPYKSGGGILLGDFGGSYQTAENNIVVNPGQYGMAIGGGNNMTIRNNKIYGKKQPFTNVGLYAVNWTAKISPSHSMTVENNEINYLNADGKLNITWFDSSAGTIKGIETNKYNSNLDESILPKVIIGSAKNSSEDTPPVTPPVTDEPSLITEVYIDSFKRIAIKYLVSSIPIPIAHAEGYTSTGKLLIAMTLPRYNQAFPISVPKGDYYIKITYPELGKTETTKVTIK